MPELNEQNKHLSDKRRKKTLSLMNSKVKSKSPVSRYPLRITRMMDGPRDYQTKLSKPDKYHLYVESKKSDTNELIYKTETDSLMDVGNKLMVTKGERGGGIN